MAYGRLADLKTARFSSNARMRKSASSPGRFLKSARLSAKWSQMEWCPTVALPIKKSVAGTP